jgi:hypothetical protein
MLEWFGQACIRSSLLSSLRRPLLPHATADWQPEGAGEQAEFSKRDRSLLAA